tara:strand:+ start:1528 stop:1818 length:291 start_codon:yes stop_codon:yes gene_type:complete
MLKVISGIIVFVAVYSMFSGDDKSTKKYTFEDDGKLTINKTITKVEYDSDKYLTCYDQMSKAHKARNLDRSTSIKVKEKICKAFAKGEHINYEGKV